MALSLLSACAQHVVVPKPRPAISYGTKLGGMWVRDCTVVGVSGVDELRDIEELCARAIERWNGSSPLDLQRLTPATLVNANDLVVDVVFSTRRVTHRTWILDLYTWGLIAPWWGDIYGTLQLAFYRGDGRYLGTQEKVAREEFSDVGLTWYRTSYVEDAYRELYDELIEIGTGYLQRKAGPLLALVRPPPPVVADAPPPEEQPDAITGSATLADLPPAAPVRPPPPPMWPPPAPLPATTYVPRTTSPGLDTWSLITTERRRTADTLLERAFLSLGGVEGSYLWGQARVSSRARNELGERVPIAAGEASQRGYRLATYSAPRASGFFVAPSFGYLDQHIDIADFRRTLPQAQDELGVEISALCTDPDTGSSLDCRAPNVYGLRMRSGFGGARGGFNLLGGNSWVELMLTGELALNVVEYRNIVARVSSYRAEGNAWELLKSGSAGGNVGIRFPRAHLGTRVSVDYQLYRDFSYAEPLEFKGFVTYNADKNVYERPRTWVRGASLGAWSIAWSFALFY